MSTIFPVNPYDVPVTVDAGQAFGVNSPVLTNAREKIGGRARLVVWSSSWGGTTARLQLNPTPDGSAGPWVNLSAAITADSSEVVEVPAGCSLRLNTAGGSGTGIRAILIPLP
ncbi:MAG: hypothetical protein RLZZ127_174 [Planctomycetota bacterium]|jgi:hypothetical protein